MSMVLARAAARGAGRLAGAAALTALVSACGPPAGPFSTPVAHHLFGTLSGDADSGCVWITPGEQGAAGAPVEVRLPAQVEVAFTPQVTLTTGGVSLRAGQLVVVEDLGAGPARSRCALVHGHSTRLVGSPARWGGSVQVQPAPASRPRA